MRSWVLTFLLFAATTMWAAPGRVVLATTCDVQPKKSNLIRIPASASRDMLASKSEIALPSSLSAKIGSPVLTLEVDVDRQGEMECFSVVTDQSEDRMSGEDKEELRSSVAAGLGTWAFRPYLLQGRPAEVRATYRLTVEAKRLVLERMANPLRPRT